MQRDHFPIIFLLISTFSITNAQQRQSNITLGSSLSPATNSSSWRSRSGLYAFGFYQQGSGYAIGVFLSGIPEKTVVWTANRDKPPVSSDATLQFTTEGRLVLQDKQGEGDTAVADISLSASSASMLDSGNFVLYNSTRGIIWQSFEHPTDTILSGQPLLAGMELFSSVSETNPSTGKFRLQMQQDGNLVQYPVLDPASSALAYWSTSTFGRGDNVTLNLDADGHLYLLNSTGVNIMNITDGGGYGTRGSVYRLRIDVDGIFRLYSHNLSQSGGDGWSVVWSSSSDKCDPRGICGANSFCVLNDQKPDCSCLPGFKWVDQGNWTSGCARDFAETSGCANGYNIRLLENTIWEDVHYLVLSLTSKEECARACLEDCNCEAALFKDNECKKQRLPLRFGRRKLSDSSIAYIKVDDTSASSTDKVRSREGKKEMRTDIIVIVCVFIAFQFAIFAIFGIVIRRYHVWPYRRLYHGHDDIEDIAPQSFSYAEVEKMTDSFKEEIGRGASSKVYKGTMNPTMNGQKLIAVKKLQKVLSESEREFKTEMKVIGKTHHRNLVRLLGYSFDGPNKLLVYEYMRNGSLADVLFTVEKQQQPDWIERMGIARDVARGILYLHEECETQIIHCDIKPQNILMDDNGCAKISDFGLAKLMKVDQTKTFTGIRGTRGYVAPEWHRNLPVTVKADVYSFGVMLLEIICCRKSLDQSLTDDDQVILQQWVYQCFETGELNRLVSYEDVDKNQFERMVKVALWCILDEPSLRPSMKKVLLMLEGTVDIPVPPNPTSFFSAI